MKPNVVSWLRLQWDRVGAWTCVIAGMITLILGWVGVSGESIAAKQLPYMASNGLGGIFLLGTGAMLWLSADLRDEWRKLDRIEEAIRESGTAGIVPDSPAGLAEVRVRVAQPDLVDATPAHRREASSPDNMTRTTR